MASSPDLEAGAPQFDNDLEIDFTDTALDMHAGLAEIDQRVTEVHERVDKVDNRVTEVETKMKTSPPAPESPTEETPLLPQDSSQATSFLNFL